MMSPGVSTAPPVATAQGASAAPQAPNGREAVSVRASRHVKLGDLVSVRGKLGSGSADRRVVIEAARGGRWSALDSARAGSEGTFRASWRARRHGRLLLRMRFTDQAVRAERTRSLGVVNVYRPSGASWYGPGLYGNRLGCGGRLGPGTLGVAHRSLPCGTKVTFLYRGRSVTTRVVDRGPYVGGREWDLTAAAKQRLRFPSTGTVWSTR